MPAHTKIVLSDKEKKNDSSKWRIGLSLIISLFFIHLISIAVTYSSFTRLQDELLQLKSQLCMKKNMAKNSAQVSDIT